MEKIMNIAILVLAVILVAAAAYGLYAGGVVSFSIVPLGFQLIDTWGADGSIVTTSNVRCPSTGYDQCYVTQEFQSGFAGSSKYLDPGEAFGYGSCSGCTLTLYGKPSPPSGAASIQIDTNDIITGEQITAEATIINVDTVNFVYIQENGFIAVEQTIAPNRYRYSFNPITSAGQYHVCIEYVDDGVQNTQCEPFNVIEQLSATLTTTEYIKFTTEDVEMTLTVSPSNINIDWYNTKLYFGNSQKLFSRQNMGGGQYRIIVSKSALVEGNYDVSMEIHDANGNYAPSTADLPDKLQLKKPKVNIGFGNTPEAVESGDFEYIEITLMGEDGTPIDVGGLGTWLNLEISNSFGKDQYTTNDFTRTSAGNYRIGYEFIVGELHTLRASASSPGYQDNYATYAISVSGAPVNPVCDGVCGVGDEIECPSDCEPEPFPITWVVVIMVLFTVAGMYGLYRMVRK